MPEGMHVRVYHEDLKEHFPEVWDDDKLLATWLRLFVIADKLWPAPGEMPAGASKASVKRLAEIGIIELLPLHRYRVKGLDADRKRRSTAAKVAADARWGNANGSADSNATRIPEPDAEAMPHADGRAGPRSASGMHRDSSEENGTLRAKTVGDLLHLVEVLLDRPFNYGPGSRSRETLETDAKDVGVAEYEQTARAVVAETKAAGNRLDHAGLISAVHRRLYPFVDAKPLSSADRKAAEREKLKREWKPA